MKNFLGQHFTVLVVVFDYNIILKDFTKKGGICPSRDWPARPSRSLVSYNLAYMYRGVP